MTMRLRAVAALVTLGAGIALALPASPASAAQTDCVVTGYTAPTTVEADKLREQLRNGSVADGGGVELDNQKAWRVPAGSHVIIAVTAADETAAPTIVEYVGGFAISTTTAGTGAAGRVVSAAFPVEPGSRTATVGIRVGGSCASQDLVVRAKRAPWTTVVGVAGLAVSFVLGFLLIFLARRRPGGWLRRAAIALVPGLLAGAGEMAVLYDTGVVAPFSPVPWAFAGIGVLLALLLPLTRRRAGRAGTPAALPLFTGPVPDLGRYVPESLFARTAAGTVYRAFDPATQQRVLLKVAHPEPMGPPPAFAPAPVPAPNPAQHFPFVASPTQQFPFPASPTQQLPFPASPTQQVPGSAIPTQQIPGPAIPTQQVPGPAISTEQVSGPATSQPVPAQGEETDETAKLPPAGVAANAPGPEPIPGQPTGIQPVQYLVPDRNQPAAAAATPQAGSAPTAAVPGAAQPGYAPPAAPTTFAPTGPVTTGSQLTLIQQRFLRDTDVMRRLDSPWCLHARDAFGPVVVTDFVDGMPLRQVLVEKGRLTGPQSMVVIAGALRGLAAVHELGLVHRDVTPFNIYLDQSGRAVLADFELAAPGNEPTPPVAESPYLSPEQRAGVALDARSDLFTVGLVLSELLTGEVTAPAPDATPPVPWQALPPALAGLLQWATAPDPAARPASAPALLAEVERVAATVYGADWLTIGAVTGGILVPAGVVAAVSAVGAGAGIVGTGAGGLASGGAPTAVTGLANVGTQAGAAGGRSVLSFAPAVVGAVVAVAVAVTGAAAAPKPAAVNQDVLTVPAATVILTRTFGEAQHNVDTHVGATAQPVLDELFRVSGASSGRLTNIEIAIPKGQKGYPASFDAVATEVLTGGRTAYLYLHFDRPARSAPWHAVMAYYSLDADGAPTLDIQPLVLDPAALPGRYRAWLDAALTQHQVPSEPLLSVIGSQKSFITSSVEFANQIRGEGHFYEMLRTLGADPAGPVIHLANGTARTTFTVRVKDDFYNRPGPYSGPCDLYKVFFNRDFQADLPAGYFRELHGTLVITVSAVIPTQKTGGKVVLDDTALHIVDPSGVPC